MFYILETRAEEQKKEKEAEKHEYKIGRKKHLFRCVECNSKDNYFFLCGYTLVVIWSLEGQGVWKEFIKINHSL